MKIVRVLTLAPDGLIALPVMVEVAARPGLSGLTIVGLPGRAVAESKERVRLALRTLGVTLPATNIVINLAPASVRKDGTHYDLPIALALLMATGHIRTDAIPKNTYIIGELGLDGSVRPIRNAVVLAHHVWSRHARCLLPAANTSSVSVLEGLQYTAVQTIGDCMRRLKSGTWSYAIGSGPDSANETEPEVLLDDVIGQTVAKRAAVIAAAGGHHLLLTGPPGVGKTMLAKVVHALQPSLTTGERIEATLIHSAAGLLTAQQPIIHAAPWRSPHHTATVTALVGTALGDPGETALAHRGTLFMDELPLFSNTVIEALREPLQNGQVHLSRGGRSYRWPAEFTLVAAANPCPCGFYRDESRPCQCTVGQRQNYQRRISGPLLERFGLHVRCGRSALKADKTVKTDAHIFWRDRVQTARQRQRERQQSTNGRVSSRIVLEWLKRGFLSEKVQSLVGGEGQSMRSALQVARVGMTIADLNNESLKLCHIEEALFLIPKGLAF